MITKCLYDEILLNPIKDGADTCHIVSGYATSAMAFHHLQAAFEMNSKMKAHLIVGMCPTDGIAVSNHKGFQKLMSEDFEGRFECSYITSLPPLHSKVYAWSKNGAPIYTFIGSANYTQTAFSNSQRNCMAIADASLGLHYYESLVDETIYCTHNDAENLVTVYNDSKYKRLVVEKRIHEEHEVLPTDVGLKGLEHVKISFLDRTGNVPSRSGLNWGQREGRNRNQAYIPVSSEINRSGFFPPRTVHFTIQTDDDKILIVTRAQDNGKAIHTPHNNSLVGEYFRNRLNLPEGEFITVDHLNHYGRTDVDFYKIDNENYFMDFSVNTNGQPNQRTT
ncbi:MAG: NgoFVII family restriction endonuclease [Fibrobacter sp.]|nr:NgoFVII family restriction endonuclease [Fibrobacter sp.]